MGHEPRPVLQVGATARIVIAGQAPGTRVHASGRPFTDPSGERLRAWMGIGEDMFYDPGLIAVVPMGFCFPGLDAKGGDLPPRRECAPRWRRAVMSHLARADLLLAVGLYAQKWHLGALCQKTLSETVRGWRRCWDETQAPRVIPMPHPSWRNNAWLKKNPWFETDLLVHLRREVARLTT